MASLSIILVHYHTPRLLMRAVASLRADLADSGTEAEIVVIDNGSTVEERDIIRTLGVSVLEPGRNLGYAGGVNLGVAATTGDHVILMNSDVDVFPGCLGRLRATLTDGIAAAGPRFFWDRERLVMFPPTEIRDRYSELERRAANYSTLLAVRARQRWRTHARRHWSARDPINSYALSGGLLAVRRDAWTAVGPFDEGFPLYFEESDWLQRLAQRGFPARYVPSAEALHHHDQSAGGKPALAQWFAQSAHRFAQRHYGVWFAAILRSLDLLAPPRQNGQCLASGVPEITLAHDATPARFWVEYSPSRLGFPATTARIEKGSRTWRVPDEVLRLLGAGTHHLRLVDDTGHEISHVAFTQPPGLEPKRV
ncbi:MAG: glycosyltransferase family 2 protein [Candidatus Binatia bacterium]